LKNDSITQAAVLIGQAQRVYLATHEGPCGDALGSSLALALALEQLGKTAHLLYPDPMPNLYSFLAGQELITRAKSLPEPDLVIVADCSHLERTNPAYEQYQSFFHSRPVINIDHHITNQQFGKINLVDPQAAAAAELVYKILPALKVDITPDVATNLLTGIVSDTFSFQHASTTAETLAIASALVAKGGRLAECVRLMYRSRPLTTLKLWGRAISAIATEQSGRIIWTEINRKMLKECQADVEEAEGLIEFIAGTRGADIIVLFKEHTDDLVKVSIRTSQRADARIIAEKFGGGGHTRAAGCSFFEGLETAKKKLLSVLPAALE